MTDNEVITFGRLSTMGAIEPPKKPRSPRVPEWIDESVWDAYFHNLKIGVKSQDQPLYQWRLVAFKEALKGSRLPTRQR